MPEGIPDPGEIWNNFVNNPIVGLAVQFVVVYVVILWLGSTYWAFRDTQARTVNPVAPYLAAALIIFFTPLLFLFALLLYVLIRPRESLAEVYERSLSEESLLAEVANHELCPLCRGAVELDWIVCPTCRTRLHRVCPACQRLTKLSWVLCAYCGAELEPPAPARAPHV